MAGGTGTRFWPESTINKPKQLHCLGTDKPLLNLTLDRIEKLIPFENQIIVTGDAIADAVHQSAPQIPYSNILSEPLRRNTAPCILLAAKLIAQRDPDAVMCVLPSDHLIGQTDEFLSILENAAQLAASQDVLITLGITARYPETGYGYIEFGNEAGTIQGRAYHRVAAFREKPNKETAQEYIASGNFFWNSGMFIWSARAILKAIKTHLPDTYAAFDALDCALPPDKLKKAVDAIYPTLTGVSIDYGVMEKAQNIYGFPADIGWNDVGAWTSLEEMIAPDENGNVSQGNFISIDATGCIVSANEGVSVCIGGHDLIIVHTPEATLVCDKSRAQEIKKVFGLLEKRGLKKYL
jgi:mannose-1-phosphate guanylyltransferase